MRWAHDPRVFGPYFALGRDLAFFALGEVRPPAPTAHLAYLGPAAVSGTGHFCAGHMIPVCLALTLRWAETLPLLRWAPYLWRAVPYFALVPRARSLARPVPRARSLDIALRGRDLPFYDGRVISLHMRPSGPRGQACPSALSANPAG